MISLFYGLFVVAPIHPKLNGKFKPLLPTLKHSMAHTQNHPQQFYASENMLSTRGTACAVSL